MYLSLWRVHCTVVQESEKSEIHDSFLNMKNMCGSGGGVTMSRVCKKEEQLLFKKFDLKALGYVEKYIYII